MKANELRIGNWVLNKSSKPIQINREMFGVTALFEPIPLTPEVLEKCGFEFDESVYKSKIYGNNEWIEFDKDGDCFNVFLKQGNVIGSDDVILLYTRIEHLHQLQNLYFALTGDELIYTP